MTNFTAKIANNAVGALLAQQAVIATTANNIANVNTAGYTKRTIELETRTGGGGSGGQVNPGNGVSIGNVIRVADTFLEDQLRGAIGDQAKNQTLNDFLARAASVFNISGDQPNIGTQLTAFYNSVNDLAANPSSLELRTNMISRANDLVDQIKLTYNTLASLQTEADQRIATEIDSVNTLTTQIADLNNKIVTQESTGGTAADERDKRDLLMQQLSGKIGFTTVNNTDGSVTLSLASGFALVNAGHARALDVTKSPSFVAGTMPPALDGGVLSHIVFDYGTVVPSHVDLTATIQAAGGTLGGLLDFRGYNDPATVPQSAFNANGKVVELAARVEAITRDLLTTVNQVYLGPDEDTGTAGYQASSRDLNGNPPATYGLFTFAYTGTRDAGGVVGFPDDLALVGVDSFSKILQVAITDPKTVAAALDTNPLGGAVATSTGDGSNLIALSTTLLGSRNIGVGAFLQNTTLNDVYNGTVGVMGNMQSTAKSDLSVAQSKFVAASSSRDQVSAVSLDEEFTSLIKYQKAYTASARMVKVAGDLLDQILQLL